MIFQGRFSSSLSFKSRVSSSVKGVDCFGLFGLPGVELEFGVAPDTDFRLFAKGGECGLTEGPDSDWKGRLYGWCRD